jgi:hypothetical protein
MPEWAAYETEKDWPAVLGRGVDHEEPGVAGLAHQRRGHLHVVGVERVHDRNHLGLHELVGGHRDAALLLGELLGDEDVLSRGLGDQELRPLEELLRHGASS